jgi:thiamine transport system ATP-binding protein
LGVSAPVALDGATVRFGATVALDHVDLAVADGEVVAVLGPSGSGKSTMLRAVAGLQRLDAGRVLLGGHDVTDMPPHRRGVGLMFQDHALFPHQDVAGNVAFGLRMQGRPAREIGPRVTELLELVDLPGFGDRPIATLSGGEQQRVALARALAPEPAVLLLDEPLGALDRTLREHLLAELRSLFTRLGLTVVAVTHDQGEAFSLADRVVVMDAGRVLQAGPPARLWDAPDSRRVARLLGFANLVDVEVLDGRARTPWGEVPVAGWADGAATLLIRPGAVRLDAPDGGVAGVVESAAFGGERTTVRITVDGAPPLEAEVPSIMMPRPGEAVAVTIDASGVVPLAPDRTRGSAGGG